MLTPARCPRSEGSAKGPRSLRSNPAGGDVSHLQPLRSSVHRRARHPNAELNPEGHFHEARFGLQRAPMRGYEVIVTHLEHGGAAGRVSVTPALVDNRRRAGAEPVSTPKPARRVGAQRRALTTVSTGAE